MDPSELRFRWVGDSQLAVFNCLLRALSIPGASGGSRDRGSSVFLRDFSRFSGYVYGGLRPRPGQSPDTSRTLSGTVTDPPREAPARTVHGNSTESPVPENPRTVPGPSTGSPVPENPRTIHGPSTGSPGPGSPRTVHGNSTESPGPGSPRTVHGNSTESPGPAPAPPRPVPGRR